MDKHKLPYDQFALEVVNLSKQFSGNQVLDHLSFSLRKNENLAVVGRSGTGKSVLIKCIVKLITPDSGTILLNGKDVMNLSEDELNYTRQHVGFLFQGSALYDSMTIEENLIFPLVRNKGKLTRDEQEWLVDSTLKSVGLLSFKTKYPSELSGGMQKRAGLARTLVLKPQIILYDEPTTGLDAATSAEITDLIVEVSKQYNTSAIIVSHDINCIKKASDRVLVLDEGRILAEGSYEVLKNHDSNRVRKLLYTT